MFTLTPESVSVTYSPEWQQEYNDTIIDEEAMKKEVDEYMAEYDAKVAEVRELSRGDCAGKGKYRCGVLVVRITPRGMRMLLNVCHDNGM